MSQTSDSAATDHVQRPRCEGGLKRSCQSWPTWKVREKGLKWERNWFFACGRHLHQVAIEQAVDSGKELDVVRIRADE